MSIILDVGIVTSFYYLIQIHVLTVVFILIGVGVTNMSDDAKPPRKEHSTLLPIKISCGVLMFSVGMLGLSSFFKPENMSIWLQLSLAFGGYLFGYLTSKAGSS